MVNVVLLSLLEAIEDEYSFAQVSYEADSGLDVLMVPDEAGRPILSLQSREVVSVIYRRNGASIPMDEADFRQACFEMSAMQPIFEWNTLTAIGVHKPNPNDYVLGHYQPSYYLSVFRDYQHPDKGSHVSLSFTVGRVVLYTYQRQHWLSSHARVENPD